MSKRSSRRPTLRTYRDRRDFGRTPEPRGRDGARVPAGRSERASHRRHAERALRFVVQKHDARRLHYDVRLEVDGVMKSWAVPKGPSMDPRDRRLAIPTEDHPIEYNRFEGVIPSGLYGAGEVIVWDRGTYRNTTERDGATIPAARALADGHMTIELRGEKLTGRFALTRVGDGERPAWILVKMRDEHARAKPSLDERSVLSGRTIDDLKDGS